MEEIKGFISELKEREVETVAIDMGKYNYFVSTENLLNELYEKIGVSEVIDTYYEDMSLISNSGDLIEIHVVY